MQTESYSIMRENDRFYWRRWEGSRSHETYASVKECVKSAKDDAAAHELIASILRLDRPRYV